MLPAYYRQSLRCLCFYGLFLSTGLSAQVPASRLTLSQAVRMAVTRSAQAQIADIDAAAAQQDRALAESALLPQAAFAFNQSLQRANIDSIIGQRIPEVKQHVGPFQVLNPGIAVNAPVFDLTLWKQYGAAQDRARSAMASNAAAHEEIALLVVSQFLGVLHAKAQVAAATSRRDLSARLDKQAHDLFQDGVATEVDTLRADVHLKQDEQGLIQAQTNEETSRYALSRLIGLRPAERIELEDASTLTATPKVEAISPQEAIERRPEVQAAADGLAAARKLQAAARAHSYPSLKFSGLWGEQGSHFDGIIPSYLYQFTLSVPIFTGGALTAQREKAALDVRKAQQEQTDLQNRIEQQVLTSEAQVRSTQALIDVAESAVNLAQRELDLASDRFSQGVADNVEVVRAQTTLAEATDRQIDALFAFNVAEAQLSRAIGAVQTTYEGTSK